MCGVVWYTMEFQSGMQMWEREWKTDAGYNLMRLRLEVFVWCETYEIRNIYHDALRVF